MLTFAASPRISRALFRRILVRFDSPCAPIADDCYLICVTASLDPAVALAFFGKESTFGTRGRSVEWKSWGNMRRAEDDGLANAPVPGLNFATYPSWQNSLKDWCTHIQVRYVAQGLNDVMQAIAVYAPAFENNVDQYRQFVQTHVDQWVKEDHAMPLIVTDYRKDTIHPPGYGYGRNVGTDDKPIWVAERTGTVGSLIVHTTNGNKGSTFRGECEFIRDSPLVGIHDEISHDGTLAIILPANNVAWHGGATLPGFGNNQSYGIELHNAIGEALTRVQLDTLTWRAKQVIAEYSIPKKMVDTHRAVAVPHGRKIDPSGWTDVDFYAWRDSLYAAAPVPHPKMLYLRTTVNANLRQAPTIDPANVVKVLPMGDVAGYDVVPTPGQAVGGDTEWFHRADQLGFVHASLLEAA